MCFYFTFASSQKDVISAETSAEPILLQRAGNNFLFYLLAIRVTDEIPAAECWPQDLQMEHFFWLWFKQISAVTGMPCGQRGLELLWRHHWLRIQLCSVLIYWSWSGLPEELIPWSFRWHPESIIFCPIFVHGKRKGWPLQANSSPNASQVTCDAHGLDKEVKARW